MHRSRLKLYTLRKNLRNIGIVTKSKEISVRIFYEKQKDSTLIAWMN